jgi:hypothetical protein
MNAEDPSCQRPTLNGFEREIGSLVRVSLGLVALPICALGIWLLFRGAHEARAPTGMMLAAGLHLTYYVNVSKVIFGSVATLVGSSLGYGSVSPPVRGSMK